MVLLLFQTNSGQTSGRGLLRSGGDGRGCWHWQGEAQQAAHCCCENAERWVIVVAVLQKFRHDLDSDCNIILLFDFLKEISSIVPSYLSLSHPFLFSPFIIIHLVSRLPYAQTEVFVLSCFYLNYVLCPLLFSTVSVSMRCSDLALFAFVCLRWCHR